MRIVGSASLLLQERFVMDWNASIKRPEQIIRFNDTLFPDLDEKKIHRGDVATQIISDGPDRYIPYMRNGMMR